MIEEYQQLQDAARDVEREIRELEQNQSISSATELADLERQIDRLAVKLSSLTKAMILLRSVNNPQFHQKQKAFVRQLPQKYHSQGPRRKVVHFARRSHRDAEHPLFRSPERPCECLAETRTSVNKLREVCGRIGRRLAQNTSSKSMLVEGRVENRRVVSMDGGRVRLREPRKGRTRKGRKKFAANWREPRLFIIYYVDDEGRMADDCAPIIDGTLASCDRLFAMLQAYLVSIRITEASRVLFVADEASWIWKRIPKQIAALKLKSDQVQELIDFWHAVEYLGKIAESKKLTGVKRKHWLTIQKRRLLNGEIGAVIIELEKLLSGTRTQDQATWLNYFRTHGLELRRIDYSSSRRHHNLKPRALDLMAWMRLLKPSALELVIRWRNHEKNVVESLLQHLCHLLHRLQL